MNTVDLEKAFLAVDVGLGGDSFETLHQIQQDKKVPYPFQVLCNQITDEGLDRLGAKRILVRLLVEGGSPTQFDNLTVGNAREFGMFEQAKWNKWTNKKDEVA